MSGKRKGLGKGLDALLGDPTATDNDENQPDEIGALVKGPEVSTPASGVIYQVNTSKDRTSAYIQELPVEYLQRGRYQPRKEIGRAHV